MSSEKIIAKIKGLINLGKGSHSVEESATAFAQAQALAERHKLTLAQVEAANTETVTKEPIQEGESLYSGVRVILWKRILGQELADLNGCSLYIKYVYIAGEKGIEYTLVGRQSDIEIVKYFFDSITAQIEALCYLAMKDGKGSGKTYSNNFKQAAMNTVVLRLKQAKREARTEFSKNAGSSAAMVLVDRKDAEVQTWIRTNLKLKDLKVNYSTARDYQAVRDGMEAGQKVSLSKGMVAGEIKKLR